MSMKRRGPWALLTCLALSISACGGGGGGGGGGFPLGGTFGATPAAGGGTTPTDSSTPSEEPISISFEGSLDGFFIEGNNYLGPTPTLITAKLNREPTGTVYPVIVDSAQILDPKWGPVTATRGADGSYSALLTPKYQTTKGKYEGKLQLKLCKDPLCAAEYPVVGGALPYKLEFVSDVTLTAKLNGAGVTGYNGFTSVTSGQTLQFVAGDGATVEVQSNIPVTWRVVSSGSTRALSVSSQTDTRVAGVIVPGPLGGGIDVYATPVDSRYKYYSSVMILPQ
ncbi:hypothetical protein [Variovorax paradoxus]|uniref:hypothetical protein n=1 Tax=Variovorax paradoxus TaxID=34073 RepID=UPI001ABCB3E8